MERVANSRWVKIPDPHNPGRLLARYDPTRNLLEFVQRGKKTVVDLAALATSQEAHSATER